MVENQEFLPNDGDKRKSSLYDLSVGTKGFPALVTAHKEKLKRDWKRLYRKRNENW